MRYTHNPWGHNVSHTIFRSKRSKFKVIRVISSLRNWTPSLHLWHTYNIWGGETTNRTELKHRAAYVQVAPWAQFGEWGGGGVWVGGGGWRYGVGDSPWDSTGLINSHSAELPAFLPHFWSNIFHFDTNCSDWGYIWSTASKHVNTNSWDWAQNFFSFQSIQTNFGVPTGWYCKWPPTI